MTYTRLTKLLLLLFTVILLSDAYPIQIRRRIRRAIKAPAGKLLAPLQPVPAPAQSAIGPDADADSSQPKGLIAAEKLVLGKSGSAKGKWITVYEESGAKAAKVTDRPAGTLLAPLPDSTPPPDVVPAEQADGVGGSDEGLDEVTRRWLDLHNAARREYGAADLRWNWDLVAKAKRNAMLCTGDHSNAGENIAAASGDLSPEKSVTWWVNEAALYDWFRPGFSDATGHFTQVVWKDTQQVGCYLTECPAGTVFPGLYGVSYQATCEYHPAGNYVNPGEFERNVGQQI